MLANKLHQPMALAMLDATVRGVQKLLTRLESEAKLGVCLMIEPESLADIRINPGGPRRPSRNVQFINSKERQLPCTGIQSAVANLGPKAHFARQKL